MNNYFLSNVNWSEEQLKVIDSNPNIIIKGTAGSGKTLLALHTAIRFIRQNLKVAIIVFTKSLRTYISHFFTKHEISNIYVYYEREWQNSISQTFDIIIIDEFQDFSLEDIKTIILKAKNGVFIFGDDEQKLYNQTLDKKRTTNFKELVNFTKFDYIDLQKNYRIPKEIVALINNIYKYKNEPAQLGFSLLELVSSLYECKSLKTFSKETTKAELVHLENDTDQLEWLVNFLKTNNSFKDIGILFKQNETKNNGYFYDRKLRKEKIFGILDTQNYLKEKGIEVGYKYEANDNLNFKNEININLLTIHSSKGLEFDCVILPFYSRTNKNHNANIPYVAFSRCKNKLIILYSGIISEEMQLVQKQIVDGRLRIPTRNDEVDYRLKANPEKYKKEWEELQKEIDSMNEFYG